ncbi:MAG: DUF2141 domain-containing protein [Rubrivivax sp.]
MPHDALPSDALRPAPGRSPGRRRAPSQRLALTLALVAAGLGLGLPSAATAAELIVRVSGISAPLGQIGCSLFAQEAGFPMDTRNARVTWLAADAQGVVCRYTNVPEGRYAVAVSHDLNGNQRVDTNFVGLPTEAWGLSNTVRPRGRAPRFAVGVFTGRAATAPWVVDIQVAR